MKVICYWGGAGGRGKGGRRRADDGRRTTDDSGRRGDDGYFAAKRRKRRKKMMTGEGGSWAKVRKRACLRKRFGHVASMSTLEAIVAELKALPPPMLEEAAAFVRRLHAVRPGDGRALERASKLLTDAEGLELARAIEEGCAKIDGRDW